MFIYLFNYYIFYNILFIICLEYFAPFFVSFFHKTLPQSSASELFMTPEWNVTIGFQKAEWATQILVKVSRLTVNSSAPKPHFPLHRFSEPGVRGLVKGGGERERERESEETKTKRNRGSPPLLTGSVWNMLPSSDTWRPQRIPSRREICHKGKKAHKIRQS